MGLTKELAINMAETETSNEYLERFQTGELNKLINLTKLSMRQATDKLILRVMDGYLDPIDALIYVKKAQEQFKMLEEKIRPIAEDNIRLQKGEVYKRFDTEIIQKEVGVKYDFLTCNDPEWGALNTEIEVLKETIKQRESFLKNVTKPLELVNTDSGETYTINPAVRSGKLGIALSIK